MGALPVVRVTDDWIDDYAKLRGMSRANFLASLPFDVEEIEAWLGSPEEIEERLHDGTADIWLGKVVHIPPERK